ncbi:MAG: FAD/NAD(P)-binding oxidoreductase [Sedimenticolaceae bacterium]
MKFDRRRFLQAFGASAAAAVSPSVLRAATSSGVASRVMVIGGGFAGATVAKYLRMWGGDSVAVTLVDPKVSHTSCVLSNLVLNRRMSLGELKMSYGTLSSQYGVNFIRDRAIDIDGPKRSVKLRDGGWRPYDYLVLATGIGFKWLRNVDYKLTPHAWIAGPQTNLLARKVNSLKAGHTFVMTIPKAPYRCPPGPYERACVVADILKRKGFDGGDTKVLVLDGNGYIQAERHTFENAFNNLYGNIIEYRTGVTVKDVVSAENRVVTDSGDIVGDLVNVIPQQHAPRFIRKSGLTDGGKGWATVDPLTYASTHADYPGVHIIGDAQATGQPKSAHMANSQAKVCADAIIRLIAGLPIDEEERVANITTNSACYSPITYDEASWLTANFAYNPATGQMGLVGNLGEAERWNRENYQEMFAWASNLFTDTWH